MSLKRYFLYIGIGIETNAISVGKKNNLRSKGEFKIEQYLFENKVNFTPEKRFKDCRNIKPLPFDFAVYFDKSKRKLAFIIEFDGQQHDKLAWNFAKDKVTAVDNLNKTRKHDNIKNKYCHDKNIRLYRIPYSQYPKLELILDHILITHNLSRKKIADQQLAKKFIVSEIVNMAT